MSDANNKEMLLETIQELEPILEVLPDDTNALHSLILAYEKLGEPDKALEKAITLSGVLQERNDWKSLAQYSKEYMKLNPENPLYQDFYNMALSFLDEFEVESEEEETPAETTFDTSMSDPSILLDYAFQLDHEIDLGWTLLDNQLITDQQYEACSQSLTESRTDTSIVNCISFLTELLNQDLVNIERIIGYLSHSTSTPFVDISRFQIPEKLQTAIPADVAKRLGIVPFGRFGNDIQVALLNPLDQHLRRIIKDYFRCNVHYYLTTPDSVVGYYDKLAQEEIKNNNGND